MDICEFNTFIRGLSDSDKKYLKQFAGKGFWDN